MSMTVYKTRKAFVISSLLVMTSALMVSGLGANQAFGEEEKTCDTENGFNRFWIDTRLVPESFRVEATYQWLCLNDNGRIDLSNNKSVSVSDIGNYIVRNEVPVPVPIPEPEVEDEPTENQRTEGFVNWEQRYYDILSKFTEVSNRVGELQEENEYLKVSTEIGVLQEENRKLKVQVSVLEVQVANLNAIVMEQLNVIYEWVIGR